MLNENLAPSELPKSEGTYNPETRVTCAQSLNVLRIVKNYIDPLQSMVLKETYDENAAHYFSAMILPKLDTLDETALNAVQPEITGVINTIAKVKSKEHLNHLLAHFMKATIRFGDLFDENNEEIKKSWKLLLKLMQKCYTKSEKFNEVEIQEALLKFIAHLIDVKQPNAARALHQFLSLSRYIVLQRQRANSSELSPELDYLSPLIGPSLIYALRMHRHIAPEKDLKEDSNKGMLKEFKLFASVAKALLALPIFDSDFDVAHYEQWRQVPRKSLKDKFKALLISNHEPASPKPRSDVYYEKLSQVRESKKGKLTRSLSMNNMNRSYLPMKSKSPIPMELGISPRLDKSQELDPDKSKVYKA